MRFCRSATRPPRRHITSRPNWSLFQNCITAQKTVLEWWSESSLEPSIIQASPLARFMRAISASFMHCCIHLRVTNAGSLERQPAESTGSGSSPVPTVHSLQCIHQLKFQPPSLSHSTGETAMIGESIGLASKMLLATPTLFPRSSASQIREDLLLLTFCMPGTKNNQAACGVLIATERHRSMSCRAQLLMFMCHAILSHGQT